MKISCFTLLNTKTFDACVSDYISGVNVMNDEVNLELICIKFAHKIFMGARQRCAHATWCIKIGSHPDQTSDALFYLIALFKPLTHKFIKKIMQAKDEG